MTTLEIAKALLNGPEPYYLSKSRDAYVYWFCRREGAPMADAHASECPWLKKDDIVKALEAVAQAHDSLASWDPWSGEYREVTEAREILSLTLKGKVPA